MDTDDHSSASGADNLFSPVLGFDEQFLINNELDYDLNAVDLMLSQAVRIGTHKQVHINFSAGASYVNLEQRKSSQYFFDDGDGDANDYDIVNTKSEFNGFGPRIAADGRYCFGNGFGFLAGGSLGYFIGDMDVNSTTGTISDTDIPTQDDESHRTTTDDPDNHGVTNLRANLAVDYIYTLANTKKSTIGLEIGYQIDYYADAINEIVHASADENFNTDTSTPQGIGSESHSLSFSGFYANLKGTF
jgi:hypothetical protein